MSVKWLSWDWPPTKGRWRTDTPLKGSLWSLEQEENPAKLTWEIFVPRVNPGARGQPQLMSEWWMVLRPRPTSFCCQVLDVRDAHLRKKVPRQTWGVPVCTGCFKQRFNKLSPTADSNIREPFLYHLPVVGWGRSTPLVEGPLLEAEWVLGVQEVGMGFIPTWNRVGLGWQGGFG